MKFKKKYLIEIFIQIIILKFINYNIKFEISLMITFFLI